MKKEVAEAWVADLRTNPPQAECALYDGKGGYCCLGRLALLLGCKFKFDEEEDGYVPVLEGRALKSSCVLPSKLMKLSGMKTENGELNSVTLTQLNDNGVTFAEIAELIEQHWREL